MRKLRIGVVLSLVLMAVFVASGCTRDVREPSMFLIPEGYTGWIQIIYNQEDAKPLVKEGSFIRYDIPEDGILRTSTKQLQFGSAIDYYVYVDGEGRRKPIPFALIQGNHNGKMESYQKPPVRMLGGPIVQRFFIGTDEELEQVGPPPLPEVLKEPVS
ncbi:DUF6843 domain-containing protein [Paenibacillus turpanensis]|uniref:DUF6843 domain-containing protein n=1 Tax=Paenibacillus turpanensis TaxID=2689078 RepID=UPI00140B0996|nr:hypothetical protein [Paenibacillus turpanensis]